MKYVTTNIRLPRSEYELLKKEAAAKNISFAELVRRRINVSFRKKKKFTKEEADALLEETRKLAEENAKYFKDFDVVETLRKMRYGDRA